MISFPSNFPDYTVTCYQLTRMSERLASWPRYELPSSKLNQCKRSEVYQRMMQFVMRGQNYLGPVADILGARLAGLEERQVLDLGTGGGAW